MYHIMDQEREKFSGWDFSHLEKFKRMQEFPLTWNYAGVIQPYLNHSKSMLDMGTGGGEFLAKLPMLPIYTSATEGYDPNVEIAKQRLNPLGVEVVQIYEDCQLPFANERFDLVINRHESYEASEVYRILEDGGHFITQQVGGLNDCELNLWLLEPSPFTHWKLSYAVEHLKKAGFEVLDAKEDVTKTRFYDLGAIIYYLHAIPWQVPNFNESTHQEALVRIHAMIEDLGYVDVTLHRFLIVAKK